MKSPEEIMKEFANEHSYETWGELMYDCHEHSQIEYTKAVMEIYGLQITNEINKMLDEKGVPGFIMSEEEWFSLPKEEQENIVKNYNLSKMTKMIKNI